VGQIFAKIGTVTVSAFCRPVFDTSIIFIKSEHHQHIAIFSERMFSKVVSVISERRLRVAVNSVNTTEIIICLINMGLTKLVRQSTL